VSSPHRRVRGPAREIRATWATLNASVAHQRWRVNKRKAGVFPPTLGDKRAA